MLYFQELYIHVQIEILIANDKTGPRSRNAPASPSTYNSLYVAEKSDFQGDYIIISMNL